MMMGLALAYPVGFLLNDALGLVQSGRDVEITFAFSIGTRRDYSAEVRSGNSGGRHAGLGWRR